MGLDTVKLLILISLSRKHRKYEYQAMDMYSIFEYKASIFIEPNNWTSGWDKDNNMAGWKDGNA